jgi:hypothetical protein
MVRLLQHVEAGYVKQKFSAGTEDIICCRKKYVIPLAAAIPIKRIPMPNGGNIQVAESLHRNMPFL